jgi:glycosyltransferase involved in cell wall biosynthesis
MFHIKRKNFFYRFLYKLLNPDGKTYLKLDINILQINDMEKKSKHVLRQLEVNLSKFNIVSIETKKTYQKFKKLFKLKNLLLLPNGFDNLDKNIPNVIPFEQKENIIITVGRIGTRQKNNQLLLTALEKIDLKDWKVYFIGPIENEFMPFIEKFFNNNTYLKNKVFFTGSIKNRKKLYNWYNKSKVFCLTSRWEAFSLVLCEALYFGNYIITTNTGAAEDITDNGKIGKIIDMHDANLLASELQSIIDKKNRIDKYYKYIINHCRKYFLWENIIKNFYDNVLK